MLQYNCIIVEDEPLAAEVLQDYIEQVPFLKLKHICTDAILAMQILQEEKIDLIFLDIHLPKLKGLDFVSTLKNPPSIIITTAYHEYALRGYELNVLDYLLKPIEFSRFLTAVNKLSPLTETTTPITIGRATEEREHLFFNVSKKKVKVYLDEILYIESLKEYIKVVTKTKSIVTKFQLGEIEALLPEKKFIRVHRSYIVSREKIDAFTATDVEINGNPIPIGRGYKETVMEMLDKNAGN